MRMFKYLIQGSVITLALFGAASLWNARHPDSPLKFSVHPATSEDPQLGQSVKINGKYYLYNPRHTYMVDGVPTYYDSKAPHRTKIIVKMGAENESLPNPLAAYNPARIQQTIHDAKAAAAKIETRNKELDQIGHEISDAQ